MTEEFEQLRMAVGALKAAVLDEFEHWIYRPFVRLLARVKGGKGT